MVAIAWHIVTNFNLIVNIIVYFGFHRMLHLSFRGFSPRFDNVANHSKTSTENSHEVRAISINRGPCFILRDGVTVKSEDKLSLRFLHVRRNMFTAGTKLCKSPDSPNFV